VTFTRTTAAAGGYTFGSLTWSDGAHSVRSPIALQPGLFAMEVANEVDGNGTPIDFDIYFYSTGDYAAVPYGLVEPLLQAGTVEDAPGTFLPGGPGAVAYTMTVPGGTVVARFALFDEHTDGDDDLDLYVYKDGKQVGRSIGWDSNDRVTLHNPEPGNYVVYVHAWATEGPDANFTLFRWLVPAQDAGNTVVSAPPKAQPYEPGKIRLTFDPLPTGVKYLGVVVHEVNGVEGARTLVNVERRLGYLPVVAHQ
jgi:hypothetical protein